MSTQETSIKRITHFSKKLLAWFDHNGRKDLPWQTDKTAYRVWVSEIMLQQTQVSAVIGYYQRFMSHFPTLEALANADEEQVLAQWAGLGYYARARNLHKSAKHIINELNAEFPNDLDSIVALPGIGRSTAGAILSIAQDNAHPILDGNVKRVLCRLHDIEGWPGQSHIEKQLWQLAESYTPKQRSGDYTQAIMDLGATLCTRSKPQCEACPFQSNCLAYANETVAQRPTSKPKKKNPTKELWLLDIKSEQGVLFEKRPPTGIWGSLYSLPELSREYTLDEIEDQIEGVFGLKVGSIKTSEPFKHIFSHYDLIAHPVEINVSAQALSKIEEKQFYWLNEEEVKDKGLPAPIKNYLGRRK